MRALSSSVGLEKRWWFFMAEARTERELTLKATTEPTSRQLIEQGGALPSETRKLAV